MSHTQPLGKCSTIAPDLPALHSFLHSFLPSHLPLLSALPSPLSRFISPHPFLPPLPLPFSPHKTPLVPPPAVSPKPHRPQLLAESLQIRRCLGKNAPRRRKRRRETQGTKLESSVAMVSFAASLASQIGFLIASLNKNNYKSVAFELSLLTEYGAAGTLILLRSCLEQVNLQEGEVQNLPLKLELLAVVIRHLVHQPNFSTTFCEAVKDVPFSEDLLGDLSKALKLSLFEQISLGLALTDAEDPNWQQEGHNFCKAKIIELYQSPAAGASEAIIDQILLFLYESEGLSKHVPAVVQALSVLQPGAHTSLLLTPLLHKEVNEVDCLRCFDAVSASDSSVPADLMLQLDNAIEVAGVMEELGYSCTCDLTHCNEILSLFQPLNDNSVARIIGMVSRTHTGLDDSQGTYGTFYTALFSSASIDTSWMTTWDVDVLLDSIKELAPGLNWRTVLENLDHEGFYLPDQKAFNLLMSIYGKACQEPFPVEAVCGTVWRNGEGQLSFLRYAVFATPEVLTFARSSLPQLPLEGLHGHELNYGNPNQAWLSVDLLEVLCQLAEMGHASSVRSLLEYPLKNCPETLLLGLVQVKTTWNLIQLEIFASLFPTYLGGGANSSIVLHQLWFLNPEMVLRGMVEVQSKDLSCVPKIIDACQDLKVLHTVLDATPFPFSIELAAFASRKDYLNLEKWLHDNINSHRDAFFQACLKFLRERTIAAEPRNDGSGVASHRSGPISSLPLETTATFFKVLQANPGQLVSRDLVEEMKRLHAAAVRVNPRLLSVGASEQATSESFASDIDEEANSYFRDIYGGQFTNDNVVAMLERFKESPVKREQEIFACMIQSLFDEYRFFPKYPEKELIITAVLFGSLIKRRLVSSLTLGVALRYVLDALRKPLDSKMFSFGLTALEQFMDRLVEWPSYCNHILQITHVRESHGPLVEFIDRVLAHDSVIPSEPSAASTVAPARQHQNSPGQISSSPSISISEMEASDTLSKSAVTSVTDSQLGQQQQQLQLQHLQQSLHEEKLKNSNVSSVGFLKQPALGQIASSQQPASSNQMFELGNGQKPAQTLQTTTYQQATSGQSNQAMSSSQSFNRVLGAGALRQTPFTTGFGHALNIETLVAAAERRDIPIEAPSSDVQDKIAFIINNISTANIDMKSREFLEVLKEQYYPWFAQYMVMKRASIEPNFHDVYLKFLDKINSKGLHKEIVKATYENCKVLLRSELIKSSSEERSLLKNLGSWLGKLTIGRNQALRAREIDPKLLITEAYEKGLMIAVIPFTSKILEPCQSSLAYQPPNPWTMGILGLLAEIYALPNLKMNLKFDIEVLFKNLGVDMKDVKPTQLLKGRPREVEGNPDFSNKDLTATHQQPSPVTTDSSSASIATLGQVDLPSEASVIASQSSIPHSAVLSQLVTSGHLSSSLVTAEEEKVPTLAATDRVLSGQGLSQTAPLPSPYSSNQLSMPIPNLSTYVVVNSKLAALGQQLQLSRIVPLAMERAIREIITPVVDRSVTIACMTTRELVTKDYAMEADDNRTRHAANLMVASLAGSLAHVTCKEPLRVAMANHLRNLLQALNVTGEVLEQAVLLVTNDNLDLGCAVIEKAATEKALRDLEEAIGTPLAIRRKQRETMGARFYDATVYSQGNLGRLPEALRPKPGRLSNAQQRVYEDFARLPWQNQPTQTPPVAPAAPIGSSSISVVSGLGSYTPAAAQGALNSYTGIGGPQAALGMGALAPSLDPSSEELDHRIPSPLSLASSTSGLLEGGARQILETGTGLSNFGAVGSGVIEVTNAEATSSLKDGSSMVPPTASPPLPIEQPGITGVEPSLTTGEVLEKYRLIAQKLDEAISESLHTGYTSPSQDQEIQGLILEISDIISQCISRDEAALAVAQKVFKRLYESTSSALHVHTHLAILAAIRDVCKRVVKELTSWVIYSDEERKFNREITVGLIKSELINLTDFNLHLAKLMDGGRNTAATEFAVYLVQTCMVQDAGVSATELYNVIDALGKAAQRPGSPESLQQLVEIAKNTSSIAMGQTGPVSGKDDKVRLAKEKRPTSSRGGALREDSKVASKDSASADPAGLREQVAMLFDDWARVCDASGSNDKGYAVYISQLQHTGLLKGDDVSDRFFRILTELAVTHSLNSESPLPSSVPQAAQQQQQGQPFAAVDAYSKLVVLLVKYYAVDPAMSKINLLNRVFSVTVRVIQRDADEKKTGFHPRPYFRLFVTWLMDFNSPDPALDASNFQVLTAFANAFMQLQPLRVPGWSFAWLELISHRMFMPKLLLSNSQKGWPLVQRLLVALFKFMEPYLRNADLSEPVRLLYKGTLRVLLVLLHDFPEFLCDNHFSFCDVIPPSCIQMRNLILSAFPRNMRLPDPFTPNLKVDLLPEISQSPRILSDVEFAPKNKQLKSEIDDYLKTRQPLSLSLVDLKQRLMLLQHEAASAGTRYNVPLINALVLYVGMQGIQQLQSKTTQQLAVPTAPITHSAPMDIFQRLIIELDTEGRYLFLNAVANQLRYPNNHTHYFSCVLLYLFAEANQEIIQEQITRVLLERLIVNRPHPWGLLITFIELIKNPRYNFWSHGFTRCAPEIEKLFESVARSCMGPPLKPVEDDLGSTMAAEGMKG